MRELQTILVAGVTSAVVCVSAMCLFFMSFHVKTQAGVCEKHGWEMEGTGPYQHKHCFDPKTGAMYLPPEIDP